MAYYHLGVDFKVKTITVDGNKAKLAIWVSAELSTTTCLLCFDQKVALLQHHLLWFGRASLSSPSFTCPFVLVRSSSEPPLLSSRTDSGLLQDTAGQERFRTLTPSYYRGAQGVILGLFIYCSLLLLTHVHHDRSVLSSSQDETLPQNVNSFMVLVSGLDVCRFPAELGLRL